MTMTRTHTFTHTFTGTDLVKPLVKAMLKNADRFEWTLQGFGMLRTYLDDDHNLRLHVWDPRFKVEGVDEVHTHPWNFHSFVVAGEVENVRLSAGLAEDGNYMEQKLRCGVGGGLCGDPRSVSLREHRPEIVKEGETYTQKAHEIHRSSPASGTVTIIQREFLDDTEHAYVYIPKGQEWCSAEPRLATAEEVETITVDALARWF